MGNSSSSSSGSGQRPGGQSGPLHGQPPGQQPHGTPQPYPYAPSPVYTPQTHYPFPFSNVPVTNGQYYGGYGQGMPGQAYGPGGGYQASPPAYHQAAYMAPFPKTQEVQRTATIKNQVNLKKPTLKLERVADSHVYAISFKFDASSDGRICTFVDAKEDVKAACAITTSQPPPPPIYVAAGLEQSFPPAANDASHLHCVDLALHSLPELLGMGVASTASATPNASVNGGATPAAATAPGTPAPPPGTSGSSQSYAVLIRLEALTEEGRLAGRSLKDLAPGAALPDWVQSQTTYAWLVQEADGSLNLRVAKQKIWVKGEAYELQEIYGMERNRHGATAGALNEGGVVMGTPSTPEGLEDVDGNECVICMSAPRDTAALPCRHMCMCHSCAGALRTQTNKCPICRNEIEKLLHIKIKAPEGAVADSAVAAPVAAAK